MSRDELRQSAEASLTLGRVRLKDFWWRMDKHLGPTYARSWARDQVLSSLDDRTVQEALDAGTDTKVVWLAVHEALELPASER